MINRADRSDLTLTPEQIKSITGYTLRAKQREELDALKIPYLVNSRGHLIVARAAAERRLGVDSTAPVTIASEEPDFSAFST